MNFLKKLFGGGGADSTPKSVAQVDYEGYHIITMPLSEGGQFRVCATISKEIGGEMKEHKLVRADVCSTQEEASDIALRKAQQIINEQGERIFGN